MSLLIPQPKTTTFAGARTSSTPTAGTALTANFAYPGSIVTNNNDVYVANFASNLGLVSKISNGNVTLLPAIPTTQSLQSLHSTDNELLASTASAIYRYKFTQGTWSLFKGHATLRGYDNSSTNTKFNTPIWMESIQNTLYVSDRYNGVIRRIDLTTGTVSLLAGIPGKRGSNNTTTSFSNTLYYYPGGLFKYDNNTLLSQDNLNLKKLNLQNSTTEIISYSSDLLQVYTPATLRLVGVLDNTLLFAGRNTTLFAVDPNVLTSKMIRLSDLIRITGSSSPGYKDANNANAQYGYIHSIAKINTDEFVIADLTNGCIRLLDVSAGNITIPDDYPNSRLDITSSTPYLSPSKKLITGRVGTSTDIDFLYFRDYLPGKQYTLSLSATDLRTSFTVQTVKGVFIAQNVRSMAFNRAATYEPVVISIKNSQGILDNYSLQVTEGQVLAPTPQPTNTSTPTKSVTPTRTPNTTPTRTVAVSQTPTRTAQATPTPTRTRVIIPNINDSSTFTVTNAMSKQTLLMGPGVREVFLPLSPASNFEVRLISLNRGQIVRLTAPAGGTIINADNSTQVGGSLSLPLAVSLFYGGNNTWVADSVALTTPTPTNTQTLTPTTDNGEDDDDVIDNSPLIRYSMVIKQRIIHNRRALTQIPVTYKDEKGDWKILTLRYTAKRIPTVVCSKIKPATVETFAPGVLTGVLEIIPVGTCSPAVTPTVTRTSTPKPTPTRTRQPAGSPRRCYNFTLSFDEAEMAFVYPDQLRQAGVTSVDRITKAPFTYTGCDNVVRLDYVYRGDEPKTICSQSYPELLWSTWASGGPYLIRIDHGGDCGVYVPPGATPPTTPNPTPTPTKIIDPDVPSSPTTLGLVDVSDITTSYINFYGDTDTFYFPSTAGATYRIETQFVSQTAWPLTVEARNFSSGAPLTSRSSAVTFNAVANDYTAFTVYAPLGYQISKPEMYTVRVTLVSGTPTVTPTPSVTRTSAGGVTSTPTPSVTRTSAGGVTSTPTPSVTRSGAAVQPTPTVTPTQTPTRTGAAVQPTPTVTPTQTTTRTGAAVLPTPTVTRTPAATQI